MVCDASHREVALKNIQNALGSLETAWSGS